MTQYFPNLKNYNLGYLTDCRCLVLYVYIVFFKCFIYRIKIRKYNIFDKSTKMYWKLKCHFIKKKRLVKNKRLVLVRCLRCLYLKISQICNPNEWLCAPYCFVSCYNQSLWHNILFFFVSSIACVLHNTVMNLRGLAERLRCTFFWDYNYTKHV